MYIKLIQPRMLKRPMDTDIKARMSPPLGLYTIANMLRNEHTVSVENENIQDIVYDDHPAIVGITVTVDALPRAVEIAKRFRRQGIVVVAGGIHITTAAAAIPSQCFDSLCIGPAEGTWPSLLQDYSNGCLKPVYRCNGTLCGRDIVSPAYDLIRASAYLYCNIVHTSRGCPFKCDFCYNSSAERTYINRPIEDVLRDIHAVHSKHIMFIDDNFIGNPAWTRAFLRELAPLRLKWNAAVSINVVDDPQLLDEMRQSGCQSLFIGFESTNRDSISSVRKVQNDTTQYDVAVEAIHSRGIMVNASFVFGLDSDTPETFYHTLDWIVRNRIETVTSHILTPYPGTRLYEEFARDNRLLTTDLSLYNTANVVFSPMKMTPEELYSGYLWIYKNIYSFKNILKRMPRAKGQVLPYLLFNLFYRKFGKLSDWFCKLVTYRRIGLWGEKLARYLP